MRILIVRHADPEYYGDTLTEEGRREAAALAKRLASGVESTVTHLYTSPLGRARDTAAYTEKALSLTAKVLPWTQELSTWPRLAGELSGKPGMGALAVWDICGADVRTRTGPVASLSVDTQFDLAPELKGTRDKYMEIVEASDAFVAELGYKREGGRYKIVRPNREVHVVFCHGGFGLTWLAHLLSIPLPTVWTSFFLSPSSITTVLFDERSKEWAAPRAIGVGDVGHLYAEGLQLPVSKYEKPNTFGDWKRPSGIKANFF